MPIDVKVLFEEEPPKPPRLVSDAQWKRVILERMQLQFLQQSLRAAESDVQRLRAVVKELAPNHPVLRETFDGDDDDPDGVGGDAEGSG